MMHKASTCLAASPPLPQVSTNFLHNHRKEGVHQEGVLCAFAACASLFAHALYLAMPHSCSFLSLMNAIGLTAGVLMQRAGRKDGETFGGARLASDSIVADDSSV